MCLISDPPRGRKDQISRVPNSVVSPLRALFPMAMFCKNCGGFCSRGRKFCSTRGSKIPEEFNLPSTNPNGNSGQTRHADKSDKPLCVADFVKLRRNDRGSQTKKSKKEPTKDEKVKVSIFRTEHSNNNPQIPTQHKLTGLICSNT